MIGCVKVRPIRDESFRIEWAMRHADRCQLCLCLFTSWARSGQVHHLVGGGFRSDEAANLLMICAVCHRRVHGEIVVVGGVRLIKISFAEVLLAKRRGDPGEWNPGRLAELLGRALPEVEGD